jgi:hypothetical protein
VTGRRFSEWAGFSCMGRLRRFLLSLTVPLILSVSPAQSHDPSAWGGLFRSRDDGATWMSANRGYYLSGAIAFAVSPTDPNHLLLGSETGLFRSHNGGRDWAVEAPSVVVGSVFAAAFAADGRRALISTGLGVFRSEEENHWQLVRAPQGAAPARAIVPSGEVGGFFLAGWTGLYRSGDGGVTWSSVADRIPHEAATALLAVRGTPEALYAIAQGQPWASVDGGRHWARRGNGISANVDTLAEDLRRPLRFWAAGADRLFRSDDGGATWDVVGASFPEPNTAVRGIAASEEAIVLTTDRGMYRSVDRAVSWMPIVDNLPAHLEAGPLVRDPIDPDTLYAGFSLIPYPELWRRAVDHEGAFARVGASSLVGSAVLLVLVGLGAAATLRWLGHYYRRSAPSGRTTREITTEGNTLP